MKKNLRILSLLLALVMIVCLFCACTPEAPVNTDTNTNTSTATGTNTGSDVAVNTVTITVDVINSKGETETFTIETEKENLAEALLEAKLVEGEMSTYGLYIKVVNGETADYNVNGAYWTLYVGEELAGTGASDIEISNGDHYKLVYTK